MLAVVYDAPRSFTVADVPVPEPGPGEVLIKVVQAGVCGTDLHIHEGDFFAEFPLTPGHELVGIVAGLGDGVQGFAEGDRVTVNPNISCGLCHACRSGRPLLCRQLRGIGTNSPGGFAEYTTAPVAATYSAAGLSDDTAVATEPTACALHGVETLSMRPGSTALVFGAGPTGLLLAQLMTTGGAARVTVAAPTEFKLARARELGIDATHLMDRTDLPGDVAALLAATGGSGYDVVVDATGAPSVTECTVGLTRDGGTVMIYGVAGPDDRVSLSPYDIFRREITIKGSFAEISAFPAALEALRSGRVKTTGLITHRFALDDYALALEALRSDRTAHKIVLVP